MEMGNFHHYMCPHTHQAIKMVVKEEVCRLVNVKFNVFIDSSAIHYSEFKKILHYVSYIKSSVMATVDIFTAYLRQIYLQFIFLFCDHLRKNGHIFAAPGHSNSNRDNIIDKQMIDLFFENLDEKYRFVYDGSTAYDVDWKDDKVMHRFVGTVMDSRYVHTIDAFSHLQWNDK